jgi:hypothetical protein
MDFFFSILEVDSWFREDLISDQIILALSLCLSFKTLLTTRSKTITLRLFGRKSLAVYTSLVFLTIFIAAVLIRLNMASISIVIFTSSLKNRFSTTVLSISFYAIKANSLLNSDEYLTAITF